MLGVPRAVGAAALIDLQSLLSPIGDAAPCGRDPRLDASPVSPYQVVKDARDAAGTQDTAFERGFGTDEEARAAAEQAQRRAWATIRQHGPDILTTIGKDLNVAVWVAEALLRSDGLAGLRDGLALTAGLVDQYWDGLYPVREPDEADDELDPRIVAIQPLAGAARECRVVPALRRVKLSDDDSAGPLTLWELERTGAGGGDGAAGGPDARLRRSTPEFLRNLADDAEACLTAANGLEAALEPRCGANAPGFSGIRELVQKIAATIRGYIPEAPAATEPAPAPAPVLNGEAPPEPPGPPVRTGPAVLDRQSAFRQLQEIAQYFRRTEPHSPLAYAIENLVRRGQLTLPELIEELIGDETARHNYYMTAGILPPEKKTS
jgi:type VI secretion system protein ImpA